MIELEGQDALIELDRIFWGLYSDELGKAVDAMALAVLEPVEPTTRPPTAPRIRVERCIADIDDDGLIYAPGWLVLYGDGGSDWCTHDHWDGAMTCALERARARALGILGRW